MFSKKISIISILIFSSFFVINSAKAEFNPNNIISDYEILNYNSMGYSEINNFLISKNGYLSTYLTTNLEGEKKSAAEHIYDVSQENKINPQFLLVLLQKEQSLIESKNPKQTQLDWATGYGCPDGDKCNTRWEGFYKQINSASLQFMYYMNGCQDIDEPNYKPGANYCSFKPGETHIFSNPYSTLKQGDDIVTIENKATAGLYVYTPHVYNGNFNFHKIWQRYFTRTYPNGTLVQAIGEPGVWLIQNGQRRPFLSKGALTTRFDVNKIISINKSELEKYPKGPSIMFPQYSLVRSPMGKTFLLVDNKKRLIESPEAFRVIGFNPEEVINASWDDIKSYDDGENITETSSYATGALLQDSSTGGVFYVEGSTKAPLLDSVFLRTKFRNQTITPVSQEELARYTKIAPYKYGDGELITSDTSPAVYVIADGTLHAMSSAEVFEGLGYKWENILTAPQRILDLYEIGDPIVATVAVEEETIEEDSEELAEENIIANIELGQE
ncbi:MAG: hypothetical protein PF572_04570 [Patescibacteria group bacterium]|jgi:hypothetical protein|nr:hypothetical protein [Patescibacteria group bacterium]